MSAVLKDYFFFFKIKILKFCFVLIFFLNFPPLKNLRFYD